MEGRLLSRLPGYSFPAEVSTPPQDLESLEDSEGSLWEPSESNRTTTTTSCSTRQAPP